MRKDLPMRRDGLESRSPRPAIAIAIAAAIAAAIGGSCSGDGDGDGAGGDGDGGADRDLLARCAVEACADQTLRDDRKNIIKTGENYWIGMVENDANKALADWMEKYCQALKMKAGCFGTHGSANGELQVRPCGMEISALKGGPPYLLLICSGAAGTGTAVDWFATQTCSKKAQVFGCDGTIWIRDPANAEGKRAYCQGKWRNGDGVATPDFQGSGISFPQGEALPVDGGWMSICG
jgi:hypothetical protein